jgi:hypothetical protein
VASGDATLRAWWAKKYQLPPTHPGFVDRSIAHHRQELFEDLMMERDELIRQLDPSLDPSEVEMSEMGAQQRQQYKDALRKRLRDVKKAISGEEKFDPLSETGDEVFDQWERELEAGKMPEGFAPVPVVAPPKGKPRG